MKAELKERTDEELEEEITEMFGTFTIGCCEFDAGRILHELDPIAFNCSVADMPDVWECSECGTEYDNEAEAEECCQED